MSVLFHLEVANGYKLDDISIYPVQGIYQNKSEAYKCN